MFLSCPIISSFPSPLLKWGYRFPKMGIREGMQEIFKNGEVCQKEEKVTKERMVLEMFKMQINALKIVTRIHQ